MNIDFLPNCAGIGGGESKLNIYCQMDEPTKKDGIWVHTDIPYKNVVFDNMSSITSGWNLIDTTLPLENSSGVFQSNINNKLYYLALDNGAATEEYYYNTSNNTLQSTAGLSNGGLLASSDGTCRTKWVRGVDRNGYEGVFGVRGWAYDYNNSVLFRAFGYNNKPYMGIYHRDISDGRFNAYGIQGRYMYILSYLSASGDFKLSLTRFNLGASTGGTYQQYWDTWYTSNYKYKVGSTPINKCVGSNCVISGTNIYIFWGTENQDIPAGSWTVLDVNSGDELESGLVSGNNAAGESGGLIREIIAGTTHGTVISEGDSFYYCGGEYNGVATNAIYKYNTVTQEWSSEEPMPVATKTGAVTIDPDGTWYLFGGFDIQGKQKRIASKVQIHPQFSPHSVIIFKDDNTSLNTHQTELISHSGITSLNGIKNTTPFRKVGFTDADGKIDENILISVGNGTQYIPT